MRQPARLLLVFALVTALGLAAAPAGAGRKKKDDGAAKAPASRMTADSFAGLALRGIGPAVTSGRISDVAVVPGHPEVFYVAAASGGVWKTTDGGTTFTPVFDGEGSYSIGCITLDPRDPDIVWVGTGENNAQRSVSFGDGVYRSLDGGKSWENLGLRESEHVGRIAIDPRDSGVAWVAAQGPLWRGGGDRGLYVTRDGGKTWKQVLPVDEWTGANDVLLDPRDPDVILATTWQRQRHTWTLVDGGPGSALWKSTDGGKTWRKITSGLPDGVHLGRIGLARCPSRPDTVYAIVEAAEGKGGVFRSLDNGETWEKRSDYVSGSPQYYNELVCDPRDPDRVYSMDTFLQVSEDGGKTWTHVPEAHKHVDTHVVWIDPDDTQHLLAGCDGGLYESWNRGRTWRFFRNLPVTQFYRLAIGTRWPFYHVYGGTQDNATLGGPVRSPNQGGIVNADWFVTVFGDGFKPAVDPEDPDTVYSEAQYGHLVRYDRRTGEMVDIQPAPAPGEPPLRWNWDSPLIISPHDPHRLYFAAQRVFRSDDRGDSWTPVSPDLTRRLDRNRLPVMGRTWSIDAVARHASTSQYGNIVQLTESPVVEGLLYAGTDDGLVQVTEDGGKTWRKIDSFPGVPEKSYVSVLLASAHDADTVYAAFDNHKMGDFTPYLLVSHDRGRTWSSLRSDLPDRHVVHALAEDPVDPDLLFAGTEFGLFFSPDRGAHWIRLTGGLPTIAVMDLAVHRRAGDLVLATFGRGFYVLDDYSPLRGISAEVLGREHVLFPVREVPWYVPRRPYGIRGKAFQGDDFFMAPNPPYGALFTYWLRDRLESRAEKRRAREKELFDAGKDVPTPTWEELRAEDEEVAPAIVLTVRDAHGNVVRRITGPRDAGFHRVAWDLRYPPATPVPDHERELAPWDEPEAGPMVLPGRYTVTFGRYVDGRLEELGEPVEFVVTPVDGVPAPPAEVAAFRAEVARLRGAVHGALAAANEADTRLEKLRKTALEAPELDPAVLDDLMTLRGELHGILRRLRGDTTKRNRWTADTPSILDRVESVVGSAWYTNAPPTATQRDQVRWAREAFADLLPRLRTLVGEKLPALEKKFDAAHAPWTPCRLPEWP